MLSGFVEHGKQIARQLGFPTANVSIPDHLYPSGVYCGKIVWKGVESKNTIIYITPGLLECHIPDWDGDLYDQEVIVTVGIHIRPYHQFECLDQVICQIKKDITIYQLFLNCNGNNTNTFVSFSGGKESCILVDLLWRLGITFDVIHFKPRDLECTEYSFMVDFLKGYSKELIIKDYYSLKETVQECTGYSQCFLGVRRDDKSFNDNTWLKNCILPLFEWTYSEVWDYINNFKVLVSDKYSQGYTSVGYLSKKNMLLKKFDDSGYIHARKLQNFDRERKN